LFGDINGFLTRKNCQFDDFREKLTSLETGLLAILNRGPWIWQKPSSTTRFKASLEGLETRITDIDGFFTKKVLT
jgi:hypothetical protein